MRIVFLDLETRFLVGEENEVGEKITWATPELMGVAVACTLHMEPHQEARYFDWFEEDAQDLVDYLHEADYLVTFNGIKFDLPVLQGVTGSLWNLADLFAGRQVDLLLDVQAALGHRVSLEAIASASFGSGKTMEARLAPIYWRDHRRFEVLFYCRKDVDYTRRIFLYQRHSESLLYAQKDGGAPGMMRPTWHLRDAQGQALQPFPQEVWDHYAPHQRASAETGDKTARGTPPSTAPTGD